MFTPQVSIIIPFYNAQEFLDKTLQSVFTQTYEGWECIMIDDGSTDSTKKELLKWAEKDDRFCYYYQDNKGLSGARNTGLVKAKGTFVYFIDADDLLEDISLEHLMDLVTDDVDIVFGKCAETTGQNKEIIKIKEHEPIVKKVYHNTNGTLLKLVLEKEVACVAWNRLYRRSFLEKNNLEFVDRLLHEDELWFFETLFYARAIILGDKITYYYNKGNSNAITSVFKAKNVLAYLKILECVFKKYGQKNLENDHLNLVSIYLTRLKQLTVLYIYPMLSNQDRKEVNSEIKTVFGVVNLKRTKKILSTKTEKRLFKFKTLEIYSAPTILNYYTNKSFVFKLKKPFIKGYAMMVYLLNNSFRAL